MNQNLIKEYQEALQELRAAQSAFEYSEPEFVESSILTLSAAEEKVRTLLRLMRYEHNEVSYS